MGLTKLRSEIAEIRQGFINTSQAVHLVEECRELEGSFIKYAKAAWPLLVGDKPFIDGWHLHALAEHLEATVRGDIKNLMILVPPRTSKTSFVSILFPTWVWTQMPRARFVYASYGETLALASAGTCREVFDSNWYKERWGHRATLSKHQANKGFFSTVQGGCRIATSIGAKVTGFGGDFIILDDPNSAFESETTRVTTNNWITASWFSRLDPGGLKVKILVQQCTHERDVQAYMSELDKSWVQVRLPMEYESSRKCRTIVLPSTAPHVWEDPREKEGELLCPNHITPAEVQTFKAALGRYIYACQYQQRPAPEEGGFLKKGDWQRWHKSSPPPSEFIVQSWDTAFTTKKTSSYSACTTWSVFRAKGMAFVMLLSAWRGKVSFGELLERATRLNDNWTDIGETKPKSSVNKRPDYILIEGKASGHSLASELISRGIAAHTFNPDKYNDKMARVHLITPYLEAGLLWVATAPPHFTLLRHDHQLVVDQAAIFPQGESRDIVDSMTQAILFLAKEKKVLKHYADLNFSDAELPEKWDL